MADIDYAARIRTPNGWLLLDDPAAGYESEAESTGQRAVAYRQRTIGADWVEGTFVVSSVRDNVTEALNVWVTGTTPLQLDDRVRALTSALEQLAYQVEIRWGSGGTGYVEVWSCMPAQYTITTQREYRLATTALVSAEVPRLPTVTRRTA